jgi:hypothetical protein
MVLGAAGLALLLIPGWGALAASLPGHQGIKGFLLRFQGGQGHDSYLINERFVRPSDFPCVGNRKKMVFLHDQEVG